MSTNWLGLGCDNWSLLLFIIYFNGNRIPKDRFYNLFCFGITHNFQPSLSIDRRNTHSCSPKYPWLSFFSLLLSFFFLNNDDIYSSPSDQFPDDRTFLNGYFFQLAALVTNFITPHFPLFIFLQPPYSSSNYIHIELIHPGSLILWKSVECRPQYLCNFFWIWTLIASLMVMFSVL